VLPITDQYLDYAKQIFDQFKSAGVRVELDDRNEKIGYKIRDCELKKIPFMLIVGEKEKTGNTISVRQHRKGDLGAMERAVFLAKVLDVIQRKSLTP
jgi:threonyl-tRNA synthetase